MTPLPPALPASCDLHRLPPGIAFEAGERHHHIANTAYPIAHGTTWRPYRVPCERHEETIVRSFAGIRDFCLYAHIPFCETRCSFCEYTVVGRGEPAEYMELLERELAQYAGMLDTPSRVLHGFDIGGGTPSLVEAESIERLVKRVRGCFSFAPGAGISIETTPRIAAAAPEKLAVWRRAGIDRVSMGVQVIQPGLLRVMNRDGNGVECHRRAAANIRSAGFRRFNVDLMYGFAGQSLAGWGATLEHVIGLRPESITLYRMRYKLTRIARDAGRVSLAEVRDQSAAAREILESAGYAAIPGKNTWSRIPGEPGTSDYLTHRVIGGMPYLGIGLGAQSFSASAVAYNDGAATKTIAPWRESIERGWPPVQHLYHPPFAHLAAKMVSVSFYFGEIDRQAFTARFGRTIEEAFPAEVDFVRRRGLMHDTPRALSLTAEGAHHFNGVVALFYAPSVQEALLRLDPSTAGGAA